MSDRPPEQQEAQTNRMTLNEAIGQLEARAYGFKAGAKQKWNRWDAEAVEVATQHLRTPRRVKVHPPDRR